jgi:hypothetical protein
MIDSQASRGYLMVRQELLLCSQRNLGFILERTIALWKLEAICTVKAAYKWV